MFNYVDHITPLPDVDTVTKRGQRWYQTPNGTYPSVTTILSAGEKKWLKDWQNMLGPKKAKKEQERCSERGTAVHLMCELFLKNVPKEDVIKGHERANIKLFNQLKIALTRNVDNIRAQEIALWSDDLQLAGRVDCIAEYKGKLSVIDFKTSNNTKGEDKIEDYFIQTTAYALMYQELYGEFIEDIVIMITSEKGLLPQIYTKKIDDYILPLLERINKFHNSQK